MHNRWIEHYLHKPNFSYSLYIRPGLVLLQYCFQFLSLTSPSSINPMPFASYFLCSYYKLSRKRFSFILFSILFMYFLFTSSILLVFNDCAGTYFFYIFSFEVRRYFPRICASTCTKSSSSIRDLPPSHLCKYSLSISA